MPLFTIHHLDGREEQVEADELVDDGRHLVLHGTGYVMDRPRRVVVRRLRHADVAGVDAPPQRP